MLPFLMVRSFLFLSISRSRCAPGSRSLLSPFLATRASHLRRTENRTTSNPQSANVDAVDAASSLSPLPPTLTKNARGGVYVLPPKDLFSSFSRPLARHSSLATKSFTIRTSEKCTRNPFRIRTSKTKDLKPFRMNTSRKGGGGSGTANPGCRLSYPVHPSGEESRRESMPAGYNSAQSSQELASPPRSSSTLPVARRSAELRKTNAIAEGANTRRGILGRRVWRVPNPST